MQSGLLYTLFYCVKFSKDIATKAEIPEEVSESLGRIFLKFDQGKIFFKSPVCCSV